MQSSRKTWRSEKWPKETSMHTSQALPSITLQGTMVGCVYTTAKVHGVEIGKEGLEVLGFCWAWGRRRNWFFMLYSFSSQNPGDEKSVLIGNRLEQAEILWLGSVLPETTASVIYASLHKLGWNLWQNETSLTSTIKKQVIISLSKHPPLC